MIDFTNKLRLAFLIIGALGVLEVGLADEFATSRSLLEVSFPFAVEAEPRSTGWQLIVDNDALALRDQDKDYTGGFALAMGGTRAANNPMSLDPALTWINARLPFNGGWKRATPDHLMQFGLILFTPEIESMDDPALDDRPFANLLFLENSQFFIDEFADRSYQATLTIGILGSGVGESAQHAVHRLAGLPVAGGYGQQISDGGELTARYAVSRQSLLLSGTTGRGNAFELKHRVEGDVGYITEGSATLAARWGRFESPWWSFAPSRSNYLPQPIPVPRNNSREFGERDFFLWAAVTLRARAYNAFLQGQFRDSDVTFSGGQLNHILGEISVGVNKTLGHDIDVGLALHYQTNEIKRGTGARNARWGGLTFRKSF